MKKNILISAVLMALAPFALADKIIAVVQNYISRVCQFNRVYASDQDRVLYDSLLSQGAAICAHIFPGQKILSYFIF